MNITIQQLAKCIPTNPNPAIWLEPLIQNQAKHQINTPIRIAAWLSTLAHESDDFRQLTENLNYSANGLVATWPNRFPTLAAAQPYHRQPEKIANAVYANRLGNSAADDGWRFRGRGLIQLTGKANYEACSKALFGDASCLTRNPDLLITPECAVASAAWFWSERRLNSFADSQDIIGICKRVNGGLNGLEDRKRRFNYALKIILA